jgi:hypothetical protein
MGEKMSNKFLNKTEQGKSGLVEIIRSIVIPLVFLILFFITLPLIRDEIISSIILLLFIITSFIIKYYRKEWILFTIGFILGIILEIGGDMIYKLQYWETQSFLGVPPWLLILWGFQFVIVHRIGTIIMRKSDKIKPFKK